jgi:hypothetical protein
MKIIDAKRNIIRRRLLSISTKMQLPTIIPKGLRYPLYGTLLSSPRRMTRRSTKEQTALGYCTWNPTTGRWY